MATAKNYLEKMASVYTDDPYMYAREDSYHSDPKLSIKRAREIAKRQKGDKEKSYGKDVAVGATLGGAAGAGIGHILGEGVKGSKSRGAILGGLSVAGIAALSRKLSNDNVKTTREVNKMSDKHLHSHIRLEGRKQRDATEAAFAAAMIAK